MTIEIIEEVMPGTSIVEEIVNLQLSVIEGDTAAAEAAAAAAAASAASASSSANTATTQAGIATTKAQEADASATAAETARTGAETAETNAETAQAAAEAARDEITDKINTAAPATLGNILRGDGTKYEPVNEKTFLKPLAPLSESAIFAYNSIGQIIAWDNSFGKPNQNPRTTSDSGQTYTRLVGSSNFRILNGKLSKIERFDVFGIATGIGSVEFRNHFRFQPGNRDYSIRFYKDVPNNIRYTIGTTNTTVDVVIDGVLTNVFTTNTITLFRESGILSSASSIDLYGDLTLILFQGEYIPPYTRLTLYVRSETFPLLNRTINLNAYASTFAQKADIAYCAWGTGFQETSPIESWTIKSISP